MQTIVADNQSKRLYAGKLSLIGNDDSYTLVKPASKLGTADTMYVECSITIQSVQSISHPLTATRANLGFQLGRHRDWTTVDKSIYLFQPNRPVIVLVQLTCWLHAVAFWSKRGGIL